MNIIFFNSFLLFNISEKIYKFLILIFIFIVFDLRIYNVVNSFNRNYIFLIIFIFFTFFGFPKKNTAIFIKIIYLNFKFIKSSYDEKNRKNIKIILLIKYIKRI